MNSNRNKKTIRETGYLNRRKVVRYLPLYLHQFKIIPFVFKSDFQESVICILQKFLQKTEVLGKYGSLPKLFYKDNITLTSQMKKILHKNLQFL